ncbi:MAG: hypothetical protein KDE53_07055 [Caldilineaceae bacterium]|nr:hypothetical protein [Caldilineaceae bacterium]
MNSRFILTLCLATVIIAWGSYTIKHHEKYLWASKPYPGFATAAELREEWSWLEPGIERLVTKYRPWLIVLFASTVIGILAANFTTKWSTYILLCIGFALSPLIAWTAWLMIPLVVPFILIIVLLVMNLNHKRSRDLMLTCYLTLHYIIFIVVGFLYFSDDWDIFGD